MKFLLLLSSLLTSLKNLQSNECVRIAGQTTEPNWPEFYIFLIPIFRLLVSLIIIIIILYLTCNLKKKNILSLGFFKVNYNWRNK